MQYGLIGEKLGHSFSKLIHEALCGYTYQLCELPTKAELNDFMIMRSFKAINVTIPYKETVIPFCDEIDDSAKQIGAVNTIINNNGILKGYNTDLYGINYLLQKNKINLKDKTVLVLGTGGTQKTACAACKINGAKQIYIASRTKREGVLSYDEALLQKDVQVIFNTSPVGMFPNNDSCPIDIEAFPSLCAVVDVVYNPLKTRLVEKAMQKGITASGGLIMLVAQAAQAASLFTGVEIPDEEIERVYSELLERQLNLVLVGMPSCGKSGIGKSAASRLQKQFVDLDACIEELAGKTIPEIFAQDGEDAFRDLEQQVTAKYGAKNNQVLSTGGGCVLRQQNIDNLRQNGIVVYINRPLKQLSVGGSRPLSKSHAALEQMLKARQPLYLAASHITVENNGNFEQAAKQTTEAFYENINN